MSRFVVEQQSSCTIIEFPLPLRCLGENFGKVQFSTVIFPRRRLLKSKWRNLSVDRVVCVNVFKIAQEEYPVVISCANFAEKQ